MSDAMWDIEYAKADRLIEEITNFCKKHNIECPVIKEYARSWELKSMLEELKSRHQ